jgi:hypothetical protein
VDAALNAELGAELDTEMDTDNGDASDLKGCVSAT